jgi:hypothetical protein
MYVCLFVVSRVHTRRCHLRLWYPGVEGFYIEPRFQRAKHARNRHMQEIEKKGPICVLDKNNQCPEAVQCLKEKQNERGKNMEEEEKKLDVKQTQERTRMQTRKQKDVNQSCRNGQQATSTYWVFLIFEDAPLASP